MRRTLVALLASIALTGSAWAVEARVAVAAFDNAADAPTYDPLGKGLQAMVTTDLAQVSGLVLVERDRLAEVTAELELADSGLVDPSTAAKVGKLLGATHLVAGTFTVVGDGMRLDARLVRVEDGEIVVAAQAEGEKDAFFELEKALVADLLEGLGAVPTAKERAAIARIHTADFDALARFGEGVALYDAERYDEAVATLREVLAKDSEFALARRTLEEYEALIADIRAKSRALELTAAEQKFVAAQAQAQKEADAVAWLQAKARDDGATWQDRAAALYLLTVGLRPHGFTNGGFRELKHAQDEYALFRASDAAYARMYVELQPKWPEVTPFLVASPSSWFDAHGDHAAELVQVRDSLFGDRQLYDMESCRGLEGHFDQAADMLLLDTRERAAELDRLSTAGRDCLGERAWIDARYDVASLYAQLLDLERSTAVLEGIAAATTDTSVLSRIEHAVRENKELAEALASGSGPLFREAVLLEQEGMDFNTSFSRHWLADARAGNARAVWELTRARRLGDHVFATPIWVGETVAFVLPRPTAFGSGPRPDDPWRTTSLRYYGDDVPRDETYATFDPETKETVTRTVTKPAPPPEPAIVLLGAGPRDDFALSLALDGTAPDDFWPVGRPPPREGEAKRVLSDGRPLVGVLFGVQDVEVAAVCDPDGVGMTPVPMRAYGVLVDGDTVRLARVREVDPDWSDKRCSLFTDFVEEWASDEIASARVAGAGDARRLEVKVTGTAVEVRVDKKTARFTLPERPSGFVGLLMHGVGYVEVSEIAFEAK